MDLSRVPQAAGTMLETGRLPSVLEGATRPLWLYGLVMC
jgi:hypothetical protein